MHWKETEHCYSLELETQRVWDYAGNNYVHRLIQSKTDGKLVELNSHCMHAKDNCGTCDCIDSGTSEALLNSKVEAVMFQLFFFRLCLYLVIMYSFILLYSHFNFAHRLSTSTMNSLLPNLKTKN